MTNKNNLKEKEKLSKMIQNENGFGLFLKLREYLQVLEVGIQLL